MNNLTVELSPSMTLSYLGSINTGEKEIHAYVDDFIRKSELRKYNDIAFVATSRI